MTLAAIAVIGGIACFERYERQTTMVILAVALAKGIEALSDIHYGLFQLNDRLDQTGASMMLRGAFSLVALSAGLYLTRDIFWACVGLALVWLGALLLFDIRRGRRFVTLSEKFQQPSSWKTSWQSEYRAKGFRRHWNLMRLALPLGLVTTMASINLNMPRYFIESRMGVASTRNLFGLGLRHSGNNARKRLAWAMRHTASCPGFTPVGSLRNFARPFYNSRSSGALSGWLVWRSRGSSVRGSSRCFTAVSMPPPLEFSLC